MQCTKEKKEKPEFSNGKIQVCAPVLGNNTTHRNTTQLGDYNSCSLAIYQEALIHLKCNFFSQLFSFFFLLLMNYGCLTQKELMAGRRKKKPYFLIIYGLIV